MMFKPYEYKKIESCKLAQYNKWMLTIFPGKARIATKRSIKEAVYHDGQTTNAAI